MPEKIDLEKLGERLMAYPMAFRQTVWNIMESQSASYWLKAAVAELLERDPCDALRDAKYLTVIMRRRFDSLVPEAAGKGDDNEETC